MTKDEKTLKIAEMVGLVANLAPPLRDNFWDKFPEPKITELQKDIYWRSLDAVKAIGNGETDCTALAKKIYSNPDLMKGGKMKLDEAVEEITRFITDYIGYIQGNSSDSFDSDISASKIPFSSVKQHIDVSMDEIKEKITHLEKEHERKLLKRFSNILK